MSSAKSQFKYDKLKQLINKLFKHAKQEIKPQENYAYFVNDIMNTIINCKQVNRAMYIINQIIRDYKVSKYESTENKNHLWVADNLSSIITNHFAGSVIEDLQILDIGGGEGDVINYIGDNLNIPKSQLFCIENNTEWFENYEFKNPIQYVFWDNKTIPNDRADVVILMVSLHHMKDNTIRNLFMEIKRILSPNGIIILKEHNCETEVDKQVINWEHHLYHILKSKDDEELTAKKCQDYLTGFVSNYKSENDFDWIFIENYFKSIKKMNRSFKDINSGNVNDYGNATNLYWKIYTHELYEN